MNELETFLNTAVMVEIITEDKFLPFEKIINEEIPILNRLISK